MDKIISSNKKALFDYAITEKHEVGIVLVGSEVKSIRSGNINLKDSYVKFINNELWLVGCHISPYAQAHHQTPDPTRNRKLLMHKKELIKISKKIQTKSLIMVPLKIYLSKQRIKLQIGLGTPKKTFDKRKSLKEKSVKKDIQQATHRYQ